MFDALTMAAITRELTQRLHGGRIQAAVQIDALSVAFEVYASRSRRWLVLSADPVHNRILLTAERVTGDAERISPLLLRLRRLAVGARIVDITQSPYERVLRFDLQNHDPEDDSITASSLIVELMGRRSNIMLIDTDDRILEAVKRVTPEMSRVRPIRPGGVYIPPPPLDRRDPLRSTPTDLVPDMTRPDRWLVSTFAGVSPVIAREAVFRAQPALEADYRNPDAPHPVITSLQAIMAPLVNHAWEPGIYVTDDGVGFSPVRLHHMEQHEGVEWVACDSVLEAAEQASQHGTTLRVLDTTKHAARQERLVTEVAEALARAQRRVESLEEQLRQSTAAEELRETGDAIYAWLHEIPARAASYTTPDDRTIALDPTLTGSQNAQEYYERYRKAQSADAQLPDLIAIAEGERDYLAQLMTLARLADGYDAIELVRMEWLDWAKANHVRATVNRGARPAKSARKPSSWTLPSGRRLMAGRTGPQNDEVTFTIAAPDDLWLHARGMPGAHVLLRPGYGATDSDIEAAARLAAWLSDGRSATTVPVDVVEKRHVRRMRHAGPGMVTFRNERTVNVAPASPEALKLAT